MSKKELVNQSDAQGTTVESQNGAISTDKRKLRVRELLDIDVTEQLKSKMDMDYLPWAIAVKHLILLHPSATWQFLPHTVYPDGSVMVKTSVTINDVTKEYILPVYGSKGRAITNPDAFQINTAYQRCLVKTIATFGLGLDVFTQDDTDDLYVDYLENTKPNKNDLREDLPKKSQSHNYTSNSDVPRKQARKEYTTQIIELIDSCETVDSLKELWKANKSILDDLKNEEPSAYDKLLASCKDKNKSLKGDNQ